MTIAMHRKVIGIVGFWQWVTLVLRFDEIKAWFERVYYCHHNASVLADMEYRFGCVLCHMGTHMSKAYYDLDDMYCEIDRVLSEKYDEGYEEGRKDMKEEIE